MLGPRRSAAKTYVARALSTVGGDAETVTAALTDALSALDRAVKAGAIHANAAARRKSRLTSRSTPPSGATVGTSGRVAKQTGKAAAAKAAKARIAAGKSTKAKGAQTAAGKARAALSKTARAEAAAAKAAEASETEGAAPAKPARPAEPRRPRVHDQEAGRQDDRLEGNGQERRPPRRRRPRAETPVSRTNAPACPGRFSLRRIHEAPPRGLPARGARRR